MLRLVLGGIALAATAYGVKKFSESEGCMEEKVPQKSAKNKKDAETSDSHTLNGMNVVCVGIGYEGRQVIANMSGETLRRYRCIVMDLENEEIEGAVHLSLNLRSVVKNYGEIKGLLCDADIVFILAAPDPGKETRAIPLVAYIAKQVGALTIPIVTLPFDFEGKRKRVITQDILEQLKPESDSMIVIPREALYKISAIGVTEVFRTFYDAEEEAMRGIVALLSSVIIGGSLNFIDELSIASTDGSRNFIDVLSIVRTKSLATIGLGEGKGENAVDDVIQRAIEHPFMAKNKLENAVGALFHFTVGTEFPITKIDEAIENSDFDTKIVYSVTREKSLDTMTVKAIVILFKQALPRDLFG